MRRRFSVILAGGALALTAPGAIAATATFNVTASCAANCDAAGMGAGGFVLGRIQISTANFAPSGAVTRADLVNFDINFGETSTGVFKAESPGYGFSATWGASVNALDDVSFVASGAPGLVSSGPFLSMIAGVNLASLVGTCIDVDCAETALRGTPATLGPVRFTPASVAPVPLPAAGPLAAAGALALAAVASLRRGRRRVA